MSAVPQLLTLYDSARLVRARALSPVDLTRSCLERIERLDGQLNAFISVNGEEALDQAHSAELELIRGDYRGSLHGIPIALKDVVDVRGMPTTAASAAYGDRTPDRDAEVVRRLRAAGAVILGKLNLHELAYGASSVVSAFGPVRNPWSRDHAAGGSSSGSAVAVATGMCYGAVGTDTGGSIRQPAAFCGVTGLKPTYGRVSTRGVMPLSRSYDHVGPVAISALDAALMLQVMEGPDPDNPARSNLSAPDYAGVLENAEGLAPGLRVGIPQQHFFDSLDPEISNALGSARGVLRQLGSIEREVVVPALTDTTLFQAETWALHRERALRAPELFQPETLRRLRAGGALDEATRVEELRRLANLRGSTGALFADVDVIVTPTTVVLPFSVADTSGESDGLRVRELVALQNTRPFNILGLPTISIPCGFSAHGLPIGMQVTGAPGAETTVLQVAHAYQGVTRWHLCRPPVDQTPASQPER